jgi:thiamine pyrophosphokinase
MLVVVLAGGGKPDAPLVTQVLDGRRPQAVIAADSGVDAAGLLRLHVDLVVGDLDSASSAGLASAERGGATVERFPEEKDATDLELALEAAAARGAEEVLVAGGTGDRLDHLAGELLLLGAASFADLVMTAVLGPAVVTVVRGGQPARALRGAARDLVTLVALHGRADGVRTSGLRYPLVDEPLLPGSSRGLSNELEDGTAEVSVGEGVVLVVQPGGAHEAFGG